MTETSNRIQVLLRKRVFVMTIMIIAIAACLAALLYGISRHDYKNALLVNTFGKQRMITQMMSKNANRIYVLINMQESDTNVYTKEELEEKISEVKEKLVINRKEFQEVLDLEHASYGKVENIKVDFGESQDEISHFLLKIDEIWKEYENSTDIIINSSKIDDKLNDALKYVNNNNEKLLEYCDEVTMVIVADSREKAMHASIIAVIMLIIGLVIIFLSIFNLYKYIITPLNQLYKGFSMVGIAREDFEISVPTVKDLEPVLSEINDAFLKLKELISLIENINSNSSFNEILEYIYNTFSVFIPYTYIGIAIIKDGGKTLEASYGISDGTTFGMPNRLLGVRTKICETSLGKIIETGEARVINDYEEYTEGKEIKDYTAAVMEAGLMSSISLPLKVNNHPLGVIFFSSRKKNIYKKEHVEFLKTLANSLSISFEKNIFEDNLVYSSILALAKLAEARDEDTGDHIERMKAYSKLITQLLYDEGMYNELLNIEYIIDIERFSPMHDIGKVGVRDRILLKPGKLTTEEFEEMKYHTVYGSQVLKAAEDNMAESGKSIFKLGIEIAGCHHEKWDGSGYPKGLKGEEIPLSARIVAIADVFDALTSKRPYKKAFPFEESFNIIVEGSGRHFDPDIVQVFQNNREKIYEMYNSLKNSGI